MGRCHNSGNSYIALVALVARGSPPGLRSPCSSNISCFLLSNFFLYLAKKPFAGNPFIVRRQPRVHKSSPRRPPIWGVGGNFANCCLFIEAPSLLCGSYLLPKDCRGQRSSNCSPHFGESTLHITIKVSPHTVHFIIIVSLWRVHIAHCTPPLTLYTSSQYLQCNASYVPFVVDLNFEKLPCAVIYIFLVNCAWYRS